MNYIKHYNLLIERAKNRQLFIYFERHHIIPKCMGGTNYNDNIVELTPEEHYVAHQLLIKIYPKEKGLVWAAILMTGHTTDNRKNNKIYGWLRRKHCHLVKQRLGNKNGSYGKLWYCDPLTDNSGKFLKGTEPDGWVRGRTYKEETNCVICQASTNSYTAKYCDYHRKMQQKKNGIASGKKFIKRKTEEDKDKFIHAITTSRTWIEAIKKAGYKTDGYSRTRMQRFAKKYNINLMAD